MILLLSVAGYTLLYLVFLGLNLNVIISNSFNQHPH